MKKKLLSFLVAICLILPCAFMLVACKDDDVKSAKVMTLELNPEVEFVLDKNDKVVTVNALNEDGNAIITATANIDYTQLNASQAAELFVKTAKEQGFIVNGTQDEITISISGEAANKLYNSVKDSMADYLQSVNITSISFEALETINKDDLIDAVEDCYKEYTEAQLNQMSEEELIKKLEQSRLETKTFVSEELKELYYTLREEAIRCAKLEALVGLNNQLLINYKESINNYKDEFIATYLNPESTYNLELKALVEAKKDLLQDKLANEVLTEAQNAVTEAQNAINSTLQSVKASVENALSQVKGFIDEVELAINNAIQLFPTLAETIDTKINQALTNLKTEFTAGDLSQYNVSFWKEEQPAA